MNHPKHEIKLYNMVFPLWLSLFLPPFWLIVLPSNFIIDSLVFLICMLVWKIPRKRYTYLRYIFKIFCFGLLSDILASAFMLICGYFSSGSFRGDELYFTIPGLILAAVLIFMFNYFVTFKPMEKQLRFRLALTFAVVTAPYTFLVPSGWVAG